MPTGAAEMEIMRKLRWQADACRMIGSPLYAALLERAAEDVEAQTRRSPGCAWSPPTIAPTCT